MFCYWITLRTFLAREYYRQVANKILSVHNVAKICLPIIVPILCLQYTAHLNSLTFILLGKCHFIKLISQ